MRELIDNYGAGFSIKRLQETLHSLNYPLSNECNLNGGIPSDQIVQQTVFDLTSFTFCYAIDRISSILQARNIAASP